MPELSVNGKRDLRAARLVAALRAGKSLSPEQMGRLCGVGGSTIRDIEAGTWPHFSTQDRIAAFFGLAKEQIWSDSRPPIARGRAPSQKARQAIDSAACDPAAQAALLGLSSLEAFEFGIAWAVIRGQRPFAPSQSVTDRALLAVEGHGPGHPARVGA